MEHKQLPLQDCLAKPRHLLLSDNHLLCNSKHPAVGLEHQRHLAEVSSAEWALNSQHLQELKARSEDWELVHKVLTVFSLEVLKARQANKVPSEAEDFKDKLKHLDLPLDSNLNLQLQVLLEQVHQLHCLEAELRHLLGSNHKIKDLQEVHCLEVVLVKLEHSKLNHRYLDQLNQ